MHSELDCAMYVWRHCLAITHPTHLVCVACIVSLISRCRIHIYIYIYILYYICDTCIYIALQSAFLRPMYFLMHLRRYAVFMLRPCSVLYAPLASTCIATLRRLHPLGYGLAMCFMHLLLPHALRHCAACMLQATALQGALSTSCFCMHSDFASLTCSMLRPCYVLYAPLAPACIATLRRLHAPGYGLAMCFVHLLLLHA